MGDECIWEPKSKNHKKGGQLSLIILFKNKKNIKYRNFFRNLSKTEVLRYLKVMIPKFCPEGHLILIFIKRI